MKVSTVTSMALLSASCFAAPIQTTALDSLTARAAIAAARADAAPVAPPAPDVAADANFAKQHWARIKLPKSHSLASHFAPHERQSRT
ncbi:hypothetical protein B0G57_12472 [Trinickia symbiotica]|uniref:DUF4148 domain-containing protein n=1 Tax=Trinickia symbiotica TaxID=863227 RepID=A0A2N7WQM7_9BURK|nr:hypothetical protein [Trinickia symbiotica]PMS31756.1 hypothetical protein C0Z20_27600 [Trinickia symbiotica]PPK41885.1 hypothetical protein B0G57_12472 [Trinickia symbiotica]